MISNHFVSISILVALLLLSVFFSANETAYSALNRIRLKHMAEKGSKRAVLALKLHKDFNKLLSTLLVGNNVANLSMAAICTLLFVYHFGDIGATISTAVLTVVVVIFADITPKVLAKQSPEAVAQFCAPGMHFFVVLLAPINYLFKKWEKLLAIIFKAQFSQPIITEAELISIVEEAEQDGAIDKEDSELLHKAIEFYDQTTRDILIPRIDVIAIEENASPDEIRDKFLIKGFSRLPVYRENIDNIVGILHMRDFFANRQGNLVAPVFVAASTNISDLFAMLKKQKTHMAIVSDEYGGTEGIVTMEDILEELVGEIWDESDQVVEKFTPLNHGRHRVLCTTNMDDFYQYFEITNKNPEQAPATLGAWLVDALGKIPEKGDTTHLEGLKIMVHKTHRRRALECIVTASQGEMVAPV